MSEHNEATASRSEATASRSERKSLSAEWLSRWPEALAAWGRFVSLHRPTWAGVRDSFAMFRLDNRSVIVDLDAVHRLGLADLPVEVLAHEVGHHVLCPADLADSARLLARVRRAMPEQERHAPMVANLYADALINDRLQRSRGLRMDEVYRRLAGPVQSPLWTFYQRSYEILWSLPAGTLAAGAIAPQTEGDAQLAARLLRVYARDWLDGAGGFAALCWRYLADGDTGAPGLVCRSAVGSDAAVPGLASLDEGEDAPILHPALDPRLNEFHDPPPAPDEPPAQAEPHGPGGQYREPFEYGQILKSLGMHLDDHDIAVRYYAERARPHVVRFPTRVVRRSTEPLPEGLEPWDAGEPVDRVDWLGTTLRSPHVIPGVTTVQRAYGTVESGDTERVPVDLDVYVDSSGSMPDPRYQVSYLALAGAILALSALRVGARVQVTLWSGAGRYERSDGFVRDEQAVLRVVTGCINGATAFPLNVLRDTYANERRRPAHIVVISDDGVDTMFTQTDERGRAGAEIAAHALRAAGGGTLLLNLRSDHQLDRIRALSTGWRVHRVTDWPELVEFARAFSKEAYER